MLRGASGPNISKGAGAQRKGSLHSLSGRKQVARSWLPRRGSLQKKKPASQDSTSSVDGVLDPLQEDVEEDLSGGVPDSPVLSQVSDDTIAPSSGVTARPPVSPPSSPPSRTSAFQGLNIQNPLYVALRNRFNTLDRGEKLYEARARLPKGIVNVERVQRPTIDTKGARQKMRYFKGNAILQAPGTNVAVWSVHFDSIAFLNLMFLIAEKSSIIEDIKTALGNDEATKVYDQILKDSLRMYNHMLLNDMWYRTNNVLGIANQKYIDAKHRKKDGKTPLDNKAKILDTMLDIYSRALAQREPVYLDLSSYGGFCGHSMTGRIMVTDTPVPNGMGQKEYKIQLYNQNASTLKGSGAILEGVFPGSYKSVEYTVRCTPDEMNERLKKTLINLIEARTLSGLVSNSDKFVVCRDLIQGAENKGALNVLDGLTMQYMGIHSDDGKDVKKRTIKKKTVGMGWDLNCCGSISYAEQMRYMYRQTCMDAGVSESQAKEIDKALFGKFMDFVDTKCEKDAFKGYNQKVQDTKQHLPRCTAEEIIHAMFSYPAYSAFYLLLYPIPILLIGVLAAGIGTAVSHGQDSWKKSLFALSFSVCAVIALQLLFRLKCAITKAVEGRENEKLVRNLVNAYTGDSFKKQLDLSTSVIDTGAVLPFSQSVLSAAAAA